MLSPRIHTAADRIENILEEFSQSNNNFFSEIIVLENGLNQDLAQFQKHKDDALIVIENKFRESTNKNDHCGQTVLEQMRRDINRAHTENTRELQYWHEQKTNQINLIARLHSISTEYLSHLRETQMPGMESQRKTSEKIDIVTCLIQSLEMDSKNSTPYKRLKNFYTLLNDSEQNLKIHRDPDWARYLKNTLICAGILLSGILPGLIALSIYVNTGRSEAKSIMFWRSQGENIVESLEQNKPSILR